VPVRSEWTAFKDSELGGPEWFGSTRTPGYTPNTEEIGDITTDGADVAFPFDLYNYEG